MANNTKFRNLFEPGFIGKVRTKNRLLKMASHPGFYPYVDGKVQPEIIDYYGSIAKGGVGLISVGGSPLGTPAGKGYDINNERVLPSLTALAEAVHKHDCPIFIQMFHIGSMIPIIPGFGHPASSSTMNEDEMPVQGISPTREVSTAEIKEIVARFGSDAEWVKKAGFQGVEINAACMHFLNSFLSRAWNKRQDEYGGSLENRARIVVEIIKEIKRVNGPDFAIVMLYNVAEPGLKDGIVPAESLELAKIFEAAGTDAIQARIEFYTNRKDTGGNDTTHFPDVALYPEAPPYATPDMVDTSHHGAGGWVPLAVAIKKIVNVPVISVGRLDPVMGEGLLKRKAVDFIAFNRRLFADHDLPNKVLEGRMEDIVPCTACMTCYDNMEYGLPPKCRINAAFGREREYEIKPAAKPKKVVVIGGGPAGLETARVAALRGHRVTLLEKESRLGGAMNLAAVVKGTDREDLPELVKYFKTQLTKLGVDVRLGSQATKELIAQLKPDVAVVAVGGAHNVPDLPGIDKKKVTTSQKLHRQLKGFLKFFGPKMLHWLTNFWMPVGNKVVIMGGNIQGCQTAEFLVERGRRVTIVESGDEIGEGLLVHLIKPQLLDWLNKKNVPMMAGVKYEEITDKGLVITTRDGKKQTIEADTILTALPLLPNTELADSLKDIVAEVYAIGDCNAPNLIVDAVHDGARIARDI